MNVDNFLEKNLIYVSYAGSRAYGTNTQLSDVDIKGLVIPPKVTREHLFSRFEQAINHPIINSKFSYTINPKNPKLESTIYSLNKFFKLAAAVNPNVIEILWVNPSDILFNTKIGEKLLKNKTLFLSSRAKFTYCSYGYAQLQRIERHRKWLIKGELQKPERKNYGLQGESLKGFGEIERLIKKDIENWNLSKFPLDELERNNLKETIWELVLNLTNNKINFGNWPEKYEEAALSKFLEDFNIKEEITNLILRETKYKNDLREYQSWLRWKQERNLERKKLEKDFSYDTKHGMQLLRLMRSAVEILEGKGIMTFRPDAKELLEIRNGSLTYEKLTEEFNTLNNKCEELYKTTKLPKSVDYEKINDFYNELLDDFNV